MKFNKALLITQTILMYIVQIPFYIAVILLWASSDDKSMSAMGILLLVGIILEIVITPICGVNIVFAIIGLIRGQNSPLKITMAIKLVLIPWFLVNAYVCIILLAGLLNPWLVWSVPVFLVIMVGFAYIMMLPTSLYDFGYLLRNMISKKMKKSKFMIFLMVCLFIFCLDVLASILIYAFEKKYLIGEKTEQ